MGSGLGMKEWVIWLRNEEREREREMRDLRRWIVGRESKWPWCCAQSKAYETVVDWATWVRLHGSCPPLFFFF